MRVDVRYLGKSEVREIAGGVAFALAPNLARAPAFIDAELARPARFREAMSALHAVVVTRGHEKRGAERHRQWLAAQREEESAVRALGRATEAARPGDDPSKPRVSAAAFRAARNRYWQARDSWENDVLARDPAMWRRLVPLDPIVTVAPDALLFEAFSKDESAYACLSLDRGALVGGGDAALGTTNVDYSHALFEHLQSLRSYRSTRLVVDPSGFEVRTAEGSGVREEKIDLPPSWLRAFGRLQAATLLPARRLELPVETLHAVLAHLRTHRERGGPRSLAFELVPGAPPRITVEPWGLVVPSRGVPYAGERKETVRVWGRRRLGVLARLLPLCDHIEVALLGTGMPSFWTLRAGELVFSLALSGWSRNDWSAGAAIDLLLPQADGGRATRGIRAALQTQRTVTRAGLANLGARAEIDAALISLAQRGQTMAMPGTAEIRYRPVLDVELSDALLGPEPEESAAARRLAATGEVTIDQDTRLERGRRLLVGNVTGSSCEAILDTDGVFTRGRCTCSHVFRHGLRLGPCRHLFALRHRALAKDAAESSS